MTRVLVVDDWEDTAEIFAELARTLGFEVLAATSAQAALEQITAFDPAILLVDLALGETSGCELLPKLRQASGRCHRAIAITAWINPEYRALARLAGFDGFLLKPVGRAALAHALGVPAGASAADRAAAPGREPTPGSHPAREPRRPDPR
ncbi:MAG TPA: response regulator [Kofleriaceae bacterium]|nr:response regulator [Kofleriaceae bacterium]